MGQGSFGIVRQVRERAPPHRIFAVKSIPIEKLQFKYKDARDYVKEVSLFIIGSSFDSGWYHERSKASQYNTASRLFSRNALAKFESQ